jgi:PAS domain-containing protein
VTCVALSFVLSPLPSRIWAGDDDEARALSLLRNGCGTPLAQATTAPEPVPVAQTAAAPKQVAVVVTAPATTAPASATAKTSTKRVVYALFDRRRNQRAAAAPTAAEQVAQAATAAPESAATAGTATTDAGEQVAQATAAPEPAASAPAATAAPAPTDSPSPTPTPLVGPPAAPSGPQILIPPKASPSPGTITPPPVPTPTPSPSSSREPVIITPQTIPPSVPAKPEPNVSAGPVGLPSPVASPSPSPAGEVLEPNTYAILGDKLSGDNKSGGVFDLDGHVNIFYQDGVLGGDHAHYDGQRYIDVTGNTFLKNRSGDTVLYAESVRFDTTTQKATLIRGRGESTQGVETGKLHFAGTTMVTDRNGVTHVERANITTCENPRGGYHLESKTLDVYPGDKAVAHSAVLFLGALAILYLPVAVISLRNDQLGSRRNPGFLPIVGYSATEGFYVKARIGFSPSDYYYGYYRIEEYTRIGLGLGYVGTLRRKDGRRQTDINFYRLKNKVDGSNNNNLQINDQENFSRSTRAQFGLNYTGNYGPLVSLPPQYNLNAALDHGNERGDRQNYSFTRSATGSTASTNNYGITDHRSFSSKLSNDFTASYTTSQNIGYPASQTLHYQTMTRLSGNWADYELNYDRYDTSLPSNVQREPELVVRPHGGLFPRQRLMPITAQYTLGVYNDPQAQLQTSRGEARLQFGPALAHFLASDLSATVTVQQDAYGTGDLKAQIGQQATLTTPLFGHVINTISYNESHVNGPLAEPFKSIDVLGNGTKQANDNLRIFNGDVYTLSLTATTFFNRQAQAVGYQLTSRPSPRSTLTLGGSFTPGAGNGFDRTNIQVTTPFGYQSDLQFQAFIDWKQSGRLLSKNIYYRHIVGNCYEIRLAYNQDLRQVTASIDLLAFPSRALNFGLGQTSLGSIIPQSLSSGAFTGGF